MHFLAFLPIVIGLGTSCLVLLQQWKDTREKELRLQHPRLWLRS